MEKLNSQERIFEIVRQLHLNHATGLTNKELAKLVGTSEANICRDMAIFERREWTIRGLGSKWRLSPAFGAIAGHIMRSFQEAKLRLTDEEARYASAMQ
jgi:DNA-binding IclR family transcriptional regulator